MLSARAEGYDATVTASDLTKKFTGCMRAVKQRRRGDKLKKKKKNRKEKKSAESEKVSKGRGKQQANKVFKMALKL